MVKRKVEGLPALALVPALVARLGTGRSSYFVGQEENVAYLKDMLRRTVDKGESNSLLVLGPRGVGKTALVRETLCQASASPGWKETAVVVRLSGLVQTDDRVALRDITKQLDLENVVGEKVFGSFAEHLSFLLASLKTGDSATSKPIVFILDEFDSFCSHKNQTLLYNLFDVAQSRAVPICVIGLSSQIDVTELLEKRVKSRFSHRHLYLWPLKDAKAHLDLALSLLTLDTEASSTWDREVKALLSTSEAFKLFESVYEIEKSLALLKRLLHLSVVLMSKENAQQLQIEHLRSAAEATSMLESSNTLSSQVADLSILELCLLIAIKHLSQIYEGEPFNFEMVFHEYLKFKRRKMATLPDERGVVSKAWETLVSLELVKPKSGAGKGAQEQFVLHVPSLATCPDVLAAAIEKLPNCPTEVTQWVSSSLHSSTH